MTLYHYLLVAVVAASALAEDAPAAVGGGLFGGRLQGIAEPRLAANVLRIYQIEKQIERLRARIQETTHVDPEKFVAEVDARLATIEDDHCPAKEFQCGNSRSSGQECISDLLVCDGHKDCHNGHDEDEDVCDTTPVTAGNIFSGLTHWKDCIVRDDHVSTLRIVATKRTKFFSARVGVQAIVTAEYEDSHGEKITKTFTMKGGYNFANRRLVLFPAESSDARIGLRCFFNHGDNERADCTAMTFTSLHECADLHLSLEKHE